MLLTAAEIGVEVVVVVVEVVVEVGLAVVAAGIVEVLVGEAVGLDVLTSPCELGLDARREVVVVSRGVELLGATGAVVDVVDVDNDPPLSVRPFALEPMVDVVEVG